MFKISTLLVLMSTLFTTAVFAAEDCNLKNLKIIERYKIPESKNFNYLVGNMGMMLWVQDYDPKTKAALEKSYANKSASFTIATDSVTCEYVEASNHSQGAILVRNIMSISEGRSELNVECIECLGLDRAPVLFEFPTMSNINDILTTTIGLKPAKARQFQLDLYRKLNDMSYRTPQANSIAILVFMLESLADLDVKEVTSEQLEYLALNFDGDINEEERQFLQKIMAQIDKIEFSKDEKGHQKIRLATGGKEIFIPSSDIPARDQATRDLTDQNLDYIKIDNGTVFTIEKKALDHKRFVQVKGIEIKGVVPFLGRVGIRPLSFDINLEAKAPVVARIQVKKGIAFTKKIPIEY